MKKIPRRVSQSGLKLGRWLLISFVFFLLVTTPAEKQSNLEDPFHPGEPGSIAFTPEPEQVRYTPQDSVVEGKAFGASIQESMIPYGNHGPFVISPDANNRDAASVDTNEIIDGSYSGYDRMGYNGSILRGGMAYSLNVPKGARIEEAFLSLHAVDASGTAASVNISVYDVDSVPVFDNAHTHTEGLLGHASTWETAVAWTPDPWVTGTWVSTPSLTSLVQHVIDRPNWQPGNYIGFVINGTSSEDWWRAWHHYGNLPGFAPKLTIRYTTPGWWDSDYQQRIQINITNHAEVALPTNYSVSFSLNTWYLTDQNELRDDGDDLRVVYFNSSSGAWIELDRVNETAFNTYKTQIWFKTQTAIPANSYDLNYFVYYDNPSASSPPNDPLEVFLLYEDFESGPYDFDDDTGWEYRELDANTDWNVIDDLGSGNYVVNGTTNGYLLFNDTLYEDVAISALVRWAGGDSRSRGVSVRYIEGYLGEPTSVPASYRIRTNYNSDPTRLDRRPYPYSGTSLINSTTAFPGGNDDYNAGMWMRYEIAAQTVSDDVVVRGRIYDINMTLRTELTYNDTISYAIDNTGYIALYGDARFDNVIVRPFIDPEPTLSLDSPLGIHLMLLTQDSLDFSEISGGDGWNVNNAPFYDHLVQDLGYVVDHHGQENKEAISSPFYLDGLHYRYDAVLISPVINSGATISLKDVAIPILTWEEYNDDELNFADSPGDPLEYAYRIYIVNTSHYPTSDQSIGWLSIYTSSNNMGWMGGYDSLPQGSELILLATNSSTDIGQLMTIEKGAIDYFPPHTAPERRVFFPGQRGDALNAAGWNLFDRCLNWTLYVDQQPPDISQYGHVYYGNGTALFYASVSDALESVSSVYLNYTIDGVTQTPVGLQWNGSHWIWSRTFAWNKEIRYTILNATDSQGNVNSSLVYVWDLPHSFVIEDQIAPSIDDGDYQALMTEDFLHFWFMATDKGLGLNLTSGSVRIATQANPSGTMYPMIYNATGYFTTDVKLPYWYTEPSVRTLFSYNFTVSDVVGLTNTTVWGMDIEVPDILAPTLVDYGVDYNSPAELAQIWANVSDLGSGIDTTAPSVNVTYKILWNNTEFGPFEMNWNDTSGYWEYTVIGISTTETFQYYFTARDRAAPTFNFVDNSATPVYFDPGDNDPPEILLVTHEYYGNGTLRVLVNVTDYPGPDPSTVEIVELKYNSTDTPTLQTASMTRFNETFWEWYHYFEWNQTIHYNVSRAKDGSGNQWTPAVEAYQSLVTNDSDPPTIIASGFDALPDYDSHLRFYLGLSEYSGVDDSSVYLNLTLPDSGQVDYLMAFNGTYYTVERDLSYYNSTSQRTLFDYNFTASDIEIPQNTQRDGGAVGILVPDVVAPTVQSHSVEAHPGTGSPGTGELTVWITTADGVNGSDISQVELQYYVGASGPFTDLMLYDGPSQKWTYDISALSHGAQITYQVNVTDLAAPTNNSIVSTQWIDFYLDEFPPEIVDYGYYLDVSGDVRFWAEVDDDQSPILSSRCQYWVDTLAAPNASRTMTYNSTIDRWESDPISFAWDTNGNYTIPYVLDFAGNSNTSLSNVWAKQFNTTDFTDPTILGSSYTNLTDMDGHLVFYVNCTDNYSGIDRNNVYLNLTTSGAGPQLYAMSFDTGNRFRVDLNLPYWEVVGSSRTRYNHTYFVSDNAGNNVTGGGEFNNELVPDLTPPLSQNFNIDEDNNQDGTLDFDVQIFDGGSGVDSTTVEITYLIIGRSWETHPMTKKGSAYVFTIEDLFIGDVVHYYINATDLAGNVGRSDLHTFGIGDETDPDIDDIGFDYMGDEDGHIIFWSEIEDPFGIIREVTIEITGDPDEDEEMLWNGERYVFSTHLTYGDEFKYKITARDTAGNTDDKSSKKEYTVEDIVPPQTKSAGGEEFQNETLVLWAVVEDGKYGSGFPADKDTVSITYRITDNIPEATLMAWNDKTNRYELRLNVNARDVVDFTIQARDKVGNLGTSTRYTFIVPDETPPEIQAIGHEFSRDSDARVQLWAQAIDPFGRIDRIEGRIVDETSTTTASIELRWNGTLYTGTTDLIYAHLFNYTILAVDQAGLNDTKSVSESVFVEDVVPPQILQTEVQDFQNGVIVIKASVKDGDRGSGLPPSQDSVQLEYMLNKDPVTTTTGQMQWNTTSNVYEFVIQDRSVGDTIDYSIIAADVLGNIEHSTPEVFALSDRTPPRINAFGYSLLTHSDGAVRFWADVTDPFGTINMVYVNISVQGSSTISKSASEAINRIANEQFEMLYNGTHYYYDMEIGFNNIFSYDIVAIDGSGLQSTPKGSLEEIAQDGAPPRINNAIIIDPGNGHLQIYAEVIEKGSGVALIELGYSTDNWASRQNEPMEKVNESYYHGQIVVSPGSEVFWLIATTDLSGNFNPSAYNVWVNTPFITSRVIPTWVWGLLAAAPIIVIVAIRKFRKVEVVGLDKDRVIAIAEQMTEEEVIARLGEHSFGVIFSYFDQREGPIPSIVIPDLLEDHFQFLVDLSDRAFSATGFVEEITEEKVSTFDIRLAETRMICVSYAFAVLNPEARGGKENMSINLLIDPRYSELINIFTPEILPVIREIRALIEEKIERDQVNRRMQRLRIYVTQIIAAYQEIYGEEAILDESGEIAN